MAGRDTAAIGARSPAPDLRRRSWPRGLDHVPSTAQRRWQLLLVVAVTVALYYQQYVGGAVSPSLLAHYGVSFRTYLTIIVVSNAAGALASLVGGVADRVGRVRIAVGGLAVAALVTVVGIPQASGVVAFGALVTVVGVVEGLVLVATPALVRDFSPQSRRGAAMGMWTLGPVLASLVVSEVASHTLTHLTAWQDQYRIAGAVGLVVAVVAGLGSAELAPALRDQLVVSQRERAIVEARARGLDVASVLERPWRQMLRLRTVVPAIGVSLFLLLYYTAVGFFVLYFTTVTGFDQARANSLGNWFWAADAVAVVTIGLLSDRTGVRKPFMVAGALGAVVATIAFAATATDTTTSYDTLVVLLVGMSACRGMAYAPWMTAFSETVEDRNPALVATGLAIWGWILRGAVVVAFLVLPTVVTSVTPVAQFGPRLAAIEVRYRPEVATLAALDPVTRQGLRATPPSSAAVARAITEIRVAFHVSRAGAVDRLLALRHIPAADRAYLAAHGPAVVAARRRAPGQWQVWWWVCVAGEVLFLPTVLLLRGRWRPSSARRDADAHLRLVDEQLRRLAAAAGDPPSGVTADPASGAL